MIPQATDMEQYVKIIQQWAATAKFTNITTQMEGHMFKILCAVLQFG